MVSPGVLPRKVSLKEAGADWYPLYQETHNRRLFSTLRLGQDYDERMKAKSEAKKKATIDMNKSAGPATVVLCAIVPSRWPELQEIIDKPLSFVGVLR